MYVFYDEPTGKVLYTLEGDSALVEGRSDWIEVPDQKYLCIDNLSVQNGQLVEDKTDAVFKTLLADEIDRERDRRMKSGLPFQGQVYDFDDVSKSRITGMATLAGFAIGAGAQAGDLYWHGGSTPFVWVASDNSFVPMDAQTCFALGQAAAVHEMTYIFAARSLKDADPIPEDFSANTYWP